MVTLADACECEVYLIVDSPSAEDVDTDKFDNRPHIIGFAPDKGVCSARLFECPFYGRISIRRFAGSAWDAVCPCRPGLTVDDTNYDPFEWSARLRNAMQEAQGARLEHGENGRPQFKKRGWWRA